MKALALGVASGRELHVACELKDYWFFRRGFVRSHLETAINSLLEQTSPQTFKAYATTLFQEPVTVFVSTWNKEGVKCCLVTDKDYDSRFAFEILRMTVRSSSTLDALLMCAQDPQSHIPVEVMKTDLKETHDVLARSISLLAQRGETLEDLDKKATALSQQSRELARFNKWNCWFPFSTCM